MPKSPQRDQNGTPIFKTNSAYIRHYRETGERDAIVLEDEDDAQLSIPLEPVEKDDVP